MNIFNYRERRILVEHVIVLQIMCSFQNYGLVWFESNIKIFQICSPLVFQTTNSVVSKLNSTVSFISSSLFQTWLLPMFRKGTCLVGSRVVSSRGKPFCPRLAPRSVGFGHTIRNNLSRRQALTCPPVCTLVIYFWHQQQQELNVAVAINRSVPLSCR